MYASIPNRWAILCYLCKISLCNITCKSFNYCVFHQQTPSHLAAEKGRFENTLKYLVGKRADINIKDNDGVIIILILLIRVWPASFPDSGESTIIYYLLFERRLCQPSNYIFQLHAAGLEGDEYIFKQTMEIVYFNTSSQLHRQFPNHILQYCIYPSCSGLPCTLQ